MARKQQLNTAKLKIIINRCYDAVNESKAGPIIHPTIKGPQDQDVILNMGMATFQALLNNMLPKNISQMVGVEE